MVRRDKRRRASQMRATLDRRQADPTGLGIFYRNSRTRLTDITDGNSQTVMIGDRSLVDSKGIWAGAPSGAVIPPGPRNPWQMATGPAPCLVLAQNNYINIKTGGLDDFSGYHTGCINLLLADGSVHIFRSITGDGQDRHDFWAIGTPSGSEVIQVLDY